MRTIPVVVAAFTAGILFGSTFIAQGQQNDIPKAKPSSDNVVVSDWRIVTKGAKLTESDKTKIAAMKAETERSRKLWKGWKMKYKKGEPTIIEVPVRMDDGTIKWVQIGVGIAVCTRTGYMTVERFCYGSVSTLNSTPSAERLLVDIYFNEIDNSNIEVQ